jgi:hypothetical protein
MTDPRDLDPRMDPERPIEMERRMGSPTPWGWIAGAVFIIVLLALVFVGGEGTRTASNNDTGSPATTGMAPKTAPPAIAVPPAQPPSTSGQGHQ